MLCSKTQPQTQLKRIQEQEQEKKRETTSFPFLLPRAVNHTTPANLPFFGALIRQPNTSETRQSTPRPHKTTETFTVRTDAKIPFMLLPSNFLEVSSTHTEIKTGVPADLNPHTVELKRSDSNGITPITFDSFVKLLAKSQTVKIHDPSSVFSSTYTSTPIDSHKPMVAISDIASKYIQNPGDTENAAEKIQLELKKLEANRRKLKVIRDPEEEKKIDNWNRDECITWVENEARKSSVKIPKMIKAQDVDYKATLRQVKSATKAQVKAERAAMKYRLPPEAINYEKKKPKLYEYEQKADECEKERELSTRKAEQRKKNLSDLQKYPIYQTKLAEALKNQKVLKEIKGKKLNVHLENTSKLYTTAAYLPPRSSQRDTTVPGEVTVPESSSHQLDRLAELRRELEKVESTPRPSEEEIEKRRMELDASLRSSSTRSTPSRQPATLQTLKCFTLSTVSPLVQLGIVEPSKGERTVKIELTDGIFKEYIKHRDRGYKFEVKVEECPPLATTSAPVTTVEDSLQHLPDVPSDNTGSALAKYQDSMLANIGDVADDAEITNFKIKASSDDGILSRSTEQATIKDKRQGTFTITLTLTSKSLSELDSDSDSD
ncbi:hypothetical protein [Vibrio aestuarianus]|uniref:hypothetical protein n=1 Tax=Vibrio aestuarianus TaxID=28171 RepID=UPI00237C9322|nr:hypothetical protein [Vibrio aestuarianus]MDE1335814.1 hypothetical protein [Vibrio aestuarianus]